MPSTYTPNLGLEKPATGEQAGTWGTTVNGSYDFIDAAIEGNVTIQLSASGYDLLTSQGVPSEGRRKIITFTGALTADAQITISPNSAQKVYFIANATSGGFSLIIRAKSSTGSPYAIAAGHCAMVYAEGTGNGASVWGVLANLQTENLLVLTTLRVNGSISFGVPPTFDQPTTFSQPTTFNGLATFNAGATVSAPLTLVLGADAAYDMYFRSPAGPLQRLPNGTAGYALIATATGPQWQSININLNAPVVGATANRVFFANASAQLAQDANFRFVPGTGVGIGMAPQYALSLGGGMSAILQLDGAASSVRESRISTAGVTRWRIGSTDGETGSDSGCNFLMAGYNDAGDSFLPILYLVRKNGHCSFGRGSDDGGGQFSIYGRSTGEQILRLYGVVGQVAHLQTWYNTPVNLVAQMEASGRLFTVGGLGTSGAVSCATLSATGSATINNLTVTGSFSAPGLGGGLGLTGNNQLLINATISPQNYATLQLGPDISPFPGPSIGLQNAPNSPSNFPTSVNYTRIFVRNHNLVIQFDISGQLYYTYLPLAAGANQWFNSQSPPA